MLNLFILFKMSINLLVILFIIKLYYVLEDTKSSLKRIYDIDEIPTGALLVTSGIVELYPYMSHEEGIKVMMK